MEENQYLEAHFLELISCVEDFSSGRQKITQRTQYFLVEVIRNIAEYAVYGEKLKKLHLDTLIERNLLGSFCGVLKTNNRIVNLQLIQTTSIMLANIKSAEKKYYIMSHPFLNALISFKYNFYDEELVDTLVSFLKSLALQIDAETVKLFTNSRTNNFPLLAVTCKLYNHQETMVRNAARIILLTVFKLNDPFINRLTMDVPFATFFCHLGCLLRDTIMQLDWTHNTTMQLNPVLTFKSQQPSQGQRTGPVTTSKSQKQPKQVDYSKMADVAEDLQDLIEFLSEIFDQCSHNRIVIKMLTNSLLYYCYLPVIMPSLVGSTARKNQIGISTALYVTTMTLKHLQSPQIQNSILSLLIGQQIPLLFRKTLSQKNEPSDPQVSYRYKWMYKLPVHYTRVTFLQEFLANDSIESFANEFGPYIGFCSELSKLLEGADILEILSKWLPNDELLQIEQYHFQISKALGHAVGVCKIYSQIHKDKYSFESFYCRHQQLQISLLREMTFEQDDIVTNDFKRQFLQFLMAKDDNLLLQTTGLIFTLITQSKASQSLLHSSNMFPVGGQLMKTMLLQRLLGNDDSPKIKDFLSKEISDERQLERLESTFQRLLFQNLQKPVAFYDPFTVAWLIKALIPEQIAFDEQFPNFRTLTMKICATLLMTISFNKNCAPQCLYDQDNELLKEAYNMSVSNMLHLISNNQPAQAYSFLQMFKQQFQSFKPQITFDQIEHLLLNPKIQVATCENLPQQLRAENDYQLGHIHSFLILRYLKAHLMYYNQDTNSDLKQGWQPVRDLDSWQVGQTVQVQDSCEIILCSTRLSQKMLQRCVLVDQDYFLLVEMISDTTMKVHDKKDLKQVSCLLDLQEPRNLIVSDTLLLYFDSANKSNYVKNMLEQNKQIQTKRQVYECKKYLESQMIQ